MDLKLKKKKITVNAPLWRRAAAFSLDYLVLNSLILFPLNRVIRNILDTGSFFEVMSAVSGGNIPIIALALISATAAIISMIYFALLETRFGQSVGKMIMGIYAVGIDGKKEKYSPMSFWSSMTRSLVVFFMFTAPFVLIFDLGYMFMNPAQQRIFEKISKTRTIYIADI
jgi:uncharacterized RDD family membrane protein YckC